MSENSPIVQLSPRKFLAGCITAALAVLVVGKLVFIPPWVVALEVLLTILALFLFGSIRYRLDKNALTYGAVLIIIATFWEPWWRTSGLRAALFEEGGRAVWEFIRHYFFTLHGLDQLIHADTMLFILGLTLFVSVIAQT